jgi:hypothetical protein
LRCGFGTFSGSFRPPLSDELGDQVAAFSGAAGNDTLRLFEPFLWGFSLHDPSHNM